MFLAIGYVPSTELFKWQLELGDKGYIVTKGGMSTNVRGVFVAVDMYDYVCRQTITVAGSKCRATLDAIKYESKENS